MAHSDVDVCSASDEEEYTLVDSVSRRSPPRPPPLPTVPPTIPARRDHLVESFHECESESESDERYASTHQLMENEAWQRLEVKALQPRIGAEDVEAMIRYQADMVIMPRVTAALEERQQVLTGLEARLGATQKYCDQIISLANAAQDKDKSANETLKIEIIKMVQLHADSLDVKQAKELDRFRDEVSAVLLQDCDGNSAMYDRLKEYIQENADEVCLLGQEIKDVRSTMEEMAQNIADLRRMHEASQPKPSIREDIQAQIDWMLEVHMVEVEAMRDELRNMNKRLAHEFESKYAEQQQSMRAEITALRAELAELRATQQQRNPRARPHRSINGIPAEWNNIRKMLGEAFKAEFREFMENLNALKQDIIAAIGESHTTYKPIALRH